MNNCECLKVFNHQDIFLGIDFNVPFATNSEISEYLLMKFYNWSLVYPDSTYINKQMKFHALHIADKWRQMYKTTQYNYNPIENYNRTEVKSIQEDYIENTASNSDGNSTNKNYEMPYDSNVERERTQNTNAQRSGGQEQRESNNVHIEKNNISGNIGVTTTQQMIEQERNIIIDIIDLYMDEFKRFFYLDI